MEKTAEMITFCFVGEKESLDDLFQAIKQETRKRGYVSAFRGHEGSWNGFPVYEIIQKGVRKTNFEPEKFYIIDKFIVGESFPEHKTIAIISNKMDAYKLCMKLEAEDPYCTYNPIEMEMDIYENKKVTK